MFSNLSRKYLSDNHDFIMPDSPDTPPTKIVSIIVISAFLFILFSILFSYVLLWKSTEKDSSEVILGMGNAHRLEYLSQQNENLSQGKTIDSTHFTIPIQEAMQIVIDKQGRVTFSKPRESF